MTTNMQRLRSAAPFAEAITAIDDQVERALQNSIATGIAMAMVIPDGELISRNYGHANADSKALVTEETLFEIGSIGKSFTAIVFMQLVAEGRMDLHAPVTDYLPWFAVGSGFPPFTIHHLLTHTSGLFGGNDQVPDGRLEVWQLRRAQTFAAPGQVFAYSNVGYKTLGLVLEAVEQKPYAEIIAERILKPLGMSQTRAAITSAMRPQLAVGYAPLFDDRLWLPEHGRVPATWLETDTGDGCIASTATDLALYAHALLDAARGEATPILSPDQLQTIRHPHAGDTPEPAYGYALEAAEHPTDELFGHGGGMVGYVSEMLIDVTHGTVVICLANGSAGTAEIAMHARNAIAAIIDGTPTPVGEASDPVVASNDWCGEWKASDGSAATLTANETGATLNWNGEELDLAVTVGRGGRQVLVFRDASRSHFPLEIEREQPPSDSATSTEPMPVIALHYGGTTFKRPNAPVIPAVDYPAKWNGYVGHYRSYNPWNSNFRIVIRNGTLTMISGFGGSVDLTPDGEGFRYGHRGLTNTNYLVFDALVNGEPFVARSGVGEEFARFFVP